MFSPAVNLQPKIAALACRSLCYLVAAILMADLPAWSMEKTDDIDTNRPSFMFSPLVLPAGSLQFENGTLYQHFQHGRTNFGIPETQVRLGLTKRTEFEMFVPNFVLNHQEHTIARAGGASDLNEVGIKHQFPSIRNFQITFIGALNIPTGSVTISGPGVQPVFRF